VNTNSNEVQTENYLLYIHLMCHSEQQET